MKKILLSISMIMSGCSTVRYIPIETTHNDSITAIHLRHDSIAVTDSTIIDRRTDTVEITHWRTETRWHTRHDTIHSSKNDTVTVTIPPEATAHQPSLWDTIGNLAIGFCIGLVATIIILLRLRH